MSDDRVDTYFDMLLLPLVGYLWIAKPKRSSTLRTAVAAATAYGVWLKVRQWKRRAQ